MPEKHAEWLDLDQYSEVPLFNTKAVVQQTGIAAPTLRAWERRYMLLSPERAQNDYRLYSERDIAIIHWLKAQVDTGMSISQSIALFRHLEQQEEKQEGFVLPTNQHVVQLEDTVTPVSPQAQTPYNMQSIQERLLLAFNELDEVTAGREMASVLAIYSIEQVCAELITPTLWEVGRRWEQGIITVTIEHFASAFFQGLLTNMFHATPISNANPLVIACCAPGEAHAIAPLILSLLMRRAGLRVAYLGQSIETAGLLQTIIQLSPALLCISVTIGSHVTATMELGQKLQQLPSPPPVFIVGGQAFEQHPDLIEQVSGIYLHGNMETTIPQIKQMALQQAAKGIS
ncbi:MAG TPA: cobalamin B12-binding domain-containing protein [Ktedonobacteraceae bacterium]|nr:cobalamin B12-binding domain-containing protein [Ktedonobacteraceae bacterium]